MNKIPETVVCYLEKDNQYLMMLRNKKKSDLNKNKYIGIGGHLENLGARYETKEECLIREIKEETDFDLIDFKYHGKVEFEDIMEKETYREIMYVFTSNNFNGVLKECEEGTFYWINKNEIFNLPLWEGDKYFLSKLDSDEPFNLKLNYINSKLKECIEIK